MNSNSYIDFIERLKLFTSKHPELITITLSNIFTTRLIGNKTHGDLAEIAIAEFINQYIYDFKSIHVGKDLYRAKSQEEDIKIINEITKDEFPVSLKAYGVGPLQLSTDKNFQMFPLLKKCGRRIKEKKQIREIFSNPVFSKFSDINVLPLIYNEKEKRCNILIFNYAKAKKNTSRIEYEAEGRGRKHPVYKFYDKDDVYICEVRYGDAAANALQRGFWTHTKKGANYFDSVTNGWIDYSHNEVLVQLFSHILVSSKEGHQKALKKIKEDISRLKNNLGVRGQ